MPRGLEEAVLNRSRLTHCLARLRAWVEDTGWSGYDPFDVRAHRLYRHVSRRAASGGPLDRAMLAAVYTLDVRFPGLVRRLLRVRPQINAMGMGQFAEAYGLLALTGDAAAAGEQQRRLEWLRQNAVHDGDAAAWAYPFGWEATGSHEAETPVGVVTAFAADAFRRSHDPIAVQAARFVADRLGRLPGPDGTFCFTYTPEDRAPVHNANVIAAELLLWAGLTRRDEEWVAAARTAFRYTLDDQEPGGAWDYWGPTGRRKRDVDPYHSAFVVRMLMRAHVMTGDGELLNAALRGFAFVRHALFENGRPRRSEGRRDPANAYSVAEGLRVACAVRAHVHDADVFADEVLTWASREMQDPSGYFYYLKWRRWTNRVPMMRWAQAPIFLGLAEWWVALTGPEQPVAPDAPSDLPGPVPGWPPRDPG